MEDKEIIGRMDYVQLMLWIAVMAFPVGMLTSICQGAGHGSSRCLPILEMDRP